MSATKYQWDVTVTEITRERKKTHVQVVAEDGNQAETAALSKLYGHSDIRWRLEEYGTWLLGRGNWMDFSVCGRVTISAELVREVTS